MARCECGLVSAGCKGVPTRRRKAARQTGAEVRPTNRPHGQKPRFAGSDGRFQLSNYLNSPCSTSHKGEAAFLRLAASIERITQARSLPDPQLTFQMTSRTS